MPKLENPHHTGIIEVLNSLVIMYMNKQNKFDLNAMDVRIKFATIDFNTNVKREQSVVTLLMQFEHSYGLGGDSLFMRCSLFALYIAHCSQFHPGDSTMQSYNVCPKCTSCHKAYGDSCEDTLYHDFMFVHQANSNDCIPYFPQISRDINFRAEEVRKN